MLLGGESFFQIVPDRIGRPAEFWARRPDKMAVLPDATRPLFPAVAGYYWDLMAKDQDLAADEVIHWRFFNPLSVWRGLSLIGAVANSITIDAFAQAWSKTTLREGGMPEVVIYGPQGLTPSEKNLLKRQFTEEHTGYKQRQEPLILEDEVYKIEPLSYPPKDMEWLEQRKLAREEIGGIFGVPDVLMGWGPESYDTDEKRVAAMRMMWKQTIIPLLGLRDGQLDTFFRKRRPLLKPNEYIATDLHGVQELETDVKALSAAAKDYHSLGVPFAAINEKLGLGFPEFEGSEQGYLPVNLLPVGAVQDEPRMLRFWAVVEKWD